MKLTEKQIELLKSAKLTNGQNAWEFVQSRPEDVRPWVAKGILSCIAKGYRLDLLMIGWETRDLRRHSNIIYMGLHRNDVIPASCRASRRSSK